MPSYNERGNIAALVEKLDQALTGIDWNILFVDDNSPDGTYQTVLDLVKKDSRVNGLLRVDRRGLSSACIEGFAATSAPFVAVMDADLQHDETILPQMLSAVKDDGHDIAVGSRYLRDGDTGNWSLSRVFKSRVATLLSRLIIPPDLRDPMSGFFLIRRETFSEVEASLSGRGFKILLDIFASSPRKLDFVEIPYTFRLRQAGESKLDNAVVREFLALVVEKSITRHSMMMVLLWLVVLGVTLAPIVFAAYPPGIDLPNHLARVFIENQLPDNEILQRYYMSEWGIVPNLAFDVVLWPMMYVLPPYVAGKVFITLAVLLMFGGVAVLRHQIFGRVGLIPLAVALFVYNIPVMAGMTNFYLGVALILFAVAFWLKSARWVWWKRLMVTSIIALGLFFTHLLVLGLYGLVIGMMRLSEVFRERRLSLHRELCLIGQFVIPIVLWFLIKAPSHGTQTAFGPIEARLVALASPVMFGTYNDIVIAASLLGLLVWGIIFRRIKIAYPMKWALIVLGILSVVMPVQLFGVGSVHIRLPLLTVFLLLSCAEFQITERILQRALIGLLVVFTGFHIAGANKVITACNDNRGDFIAALEVIEPGARLLPVVESKIDFQICPPVYNWHTTQLAVIERSAFSPLMFSHMQPLNLQPQLRHLMPKQPRPLAPEVFMGKHDPYGEPEWNAVIAARWDKDFDYLVWFHPGTQARGVPENVVPVIGTETFTIYRILPGG